MRRNGWPLAGEEGLLRKVVAELLRRIGEPADPSGILEIQGILEFQDALLKTRSTEENYLRPRMEILVDLGLVERRRRQSGFVWKSTEVTRRASEVWKCVSELRTDVDRYLDTQFFKSMAVAYDHPASRGMSIESILRQFAAAFSFVGREFGFTPARTVATLACVQAWLSGQILEIAEVFDAVEAAAQSKYGQFLHFSGGSRFDREFLIRVSPDLAAALPPV